MPSCTGTSIVATMRGSDVSGFMACTDTLAMRTYGDNGVLDTHCQGSRKLQRSSSGEIQYYSTVL